MPGERRYPPTPYSPRSRETRDYRDGWDRGWAYARDRGPGAAFLAWVDDGWWRVTTPEHRGFEAGARAWIERRQQIEATGTDPALRRAERRAAEAERRAEPIEPPY